MRLLLSRARVYRQNGFDTTDIAIEDGFIKTIAPHIDNLDFDSVIDLSIGYLFPGFVDVHVHLREPGFSYKETIRTGTEAAARGGFTTVCAMPNLKPAPDALGSLRVQLDAIARDAMVNVLPYGAITKNQLGEGALADFEAMNPNICGISDDGRGVQSDELTKQAMIEAKRLGLIFTAHCEDNRELKAGGAIHDGEMAKALGIVGINSKSEWAMVARDLRLVKEIGCKYHVCHVSTKESVALIRQAKREGVDVTCETAPHYLILTDMDILDEGRYKMNPPIRSEADREALIAGIMDGTIDMIATDHAPHSAAEKAKGLKDSVMGVVGIETSFALMYTHFVKTGKMDMDKLVTLMAIAPRQRFHIPGGEIAVGQVADLAAFDLDKEWTIEPERFASMGKATPFAGDQVFGETVMTMVNGKVVYKRDRRGDL